MNKQLFEQTFNRLTSRRKEILLKFLDNETDQVIAKSCHIQPATVRKHIEEICKQFGIENDFSDERRSKRQDLIALFAKYKPELLIQNKNGIIADDNIVFNQDKNPVTNSGISEIELDILVQEARQIIQPIIQERCSKMQVLDMSKPIGLSNIYTDVNTLEKITGRRRLNMSQLIETFDIESDDFDRFGLSKVIGNRCLGLKVVENNSKLMVLGKPGAGKTTFLKHLAIQCISDNLLTDKVPIFITLKEFAETQEKQSLSEYINNLFTQSKISIDHIKKLFISGKILLLLDGLDEVREEDIDRVVRQIQDLFNQYANNQYVVTCRIAAREYTFEDFTEVEIADFDNNQIEGFITKWFQVKESDLAERCIQQIEQNKQIRELATNPLLLTLLCIEFEDSGDFPDDRAELYKRATHTLLRKWDSKRRIEREQIYKKLNIQRKEDLLSQIAFTTFKQKEYFFKQSNLERYIADYIRNLPDAKTDPEALQVDSEQVLKSIESQHGLLLERARGIYSFSHLTFQEYFTARNIVNSCNPYSLDDKLLQHLTNQITDYRWREIFLLTSGMLPKADAILLMMKQKADFIMKNDQKLQAFLTWLQQKSLTVNLSYKQAAIRAFYLTLSVNNMFDIFGNSIINTKIQFAWLPNLDKNLVIDNELYLDSELYIDYNLSIALNSTITYSDGKYEYTHQDIISEIDEYLIFRIPLKLRYNYEFLRSLQHIKNQLPSNEEENPELFDNWWIDNSMEWGEQLRNILIQYRNIGHDWEFNEEQTEKIKTYFNAINLILECMNSNCYVSYEVRSYIEDTLLLPIEEIEKHPFKYQG
jgi:predicted NACHT family NTPase